MISLEKTFVSGDGGFASDPLTYRQMKRTEKVALYQRFTSDGKPKDFEVFHIKVDPKGKMMKFPNGMVKVMEDDKEKYPSTGQFGIIAWSFGNLVAALNRFDKLCQETDVPEEPVKTITLPAGEFTVGELENANGVPYSQAFLFVKAGVADGSILFLREERRQAKGKPSKIYRKA